jgi:hypothetical protein
MHTVYRHAGGRPLLDAICTPSDTLFRVISFFLKKDNKLFDMNVAYFD